MLGPLIVNIFAFHLFVAGGHGLFEPMLLGVCALTGYLLWVEQAAFLGLVQRRLPGARAG